MSTNLNNTTNQAITPGAGYNGGNQKRDEKYGIPTSNDYNGIDYKQAKIALLGYGGVGSDIQGATKADVSPMEFFNASNNVVEMQESLGNVINDFQANTDALRKSWKGAGADAFGTRMENLYQDLTNQYRNLGGGAGEPLSDALWKSGQQLNTSRQTINAMDNFYTQQMIDHYNSYGLPVPTVTADNGEQLVKVSAWPKLKALMDKDYAGVLQTQAQQYKTTTAGLQGDSFDQTFSNSAASGSGTGNNNAAQQQNAAQQKKNQEAQEAAQKRQEALEKKQEQEQEAAQKRQEAMEKKQEAAQEAEQKRQEAMQKKQEALQEKQMKEQEAAQAKAEKQQEAQQARQQKQEQAQEAAQEKAQKAQEAAQEKALKAETGNPQTFKQGLGGGTGEGGGGVGGNIPKSKLGTDPSGSSPEGFGGGAGGGGTGGGGKLGSEKLPSETVPKEKFPTDPSTGTPKGFGGGGTGGGGKLGTENGPNEKVPSEKLPVDPSTGTPEGFGGKTGSGTGTAGVEKLPSEKMAPNKTVNDPTAMSPQSFKSASSPTDKLSVPDNKVPSLDQRNQAQQEGGGSGGMVPPVGGVGSGGSSEPGSAKALNSEASRFPGGTGASAMKAPNLGRTGAGLSADTEPERFGQSGGSADQAAKQRAASDKANADARAATDKLNADQRATQAREAKMAQDNVQKFNNSQRADQADSAGRSRAATDALNASQRAEQAQAKLASADPKGFGGGGSGGGAGGGKIAGLEGDKLGQGVGGGSEPTGLASAANADRAAAANSMPQAFNGDSAIPESAARASGGAAGESGGGAGMPMMPMGGGAGMGGSPSGLGGEGSAAQSARRFPDGTLKPDAEEPVRFGQSGGAADQEAQQRQATDRLNAEERASQAQAAKQAQQETARLNQDQRAEQAQARLAAADPKGFGGGGAGGGVGGGGSAGGGSIGGLEGDKLGHGLSATDPSVATNAASAARGANSSMPQAFNGDNAIPESASRAGGAAAAEGGAGMPMMPMGGGGMPGGQSGAGEGGGAHGTRRFPDGTVRPDAEEPARFGQGGGAADQQARQRLSAEQLNAEERATQAEAAARARQATAQLNRDQRAEQARERAAQAGARGVGGGSGTGGMSGGEAGPGPSAAAENGGANEAAARLASAEPANPGSLPQAYTGESTVPAAGAAERSAAEGAAGMPMMPMGAGPAGGPGGAEGGAHEARRFPTGPDEGSEENPARFGQRGGAAEQERQLAAGARQALAEEQALAAAEGFTEAEASSTRPIPSRLRRADGADPESERPDFAAGNDGDGAPGASGSNGASGPWDTALTAGALTGLLAWMAASGPEVPTAARHQPTNIGDSPARAGQLSGRRRNRRSVDAERLDPARDQRSEGAAVDDDNEPGEAETGRRGPKLEADEDRSILWFGRRRRRRATPDRRPNYQHDNVWDEWDGSDDAIDVPSRNGLIARYQREEFEMDEQWTGTPGAVGRRRKANAIDDQTFGRMSMEQRFGAWQNGTLSPEQEERLMAGYQAPRTPLREDEFPEVKPFWGPNGEPAIEPGSAQGERKGPRSINFDLPDGFEEKWAAAQPPLEAPASDPAAGSSPPRRATPDEVAAARARSDREQRRPAPRINADRQSWYDDDDRAPGVLGR